MLFLKRAVAYRRAAEEARLLNPAEIWKTEAEDALFGRNAQEGQAILEPLEPNKVAFLDAQFPG